MKLTKEEIERIIDYEIVVDCYTIDEANMGWAVYMKENLHFPFEAEYLMKRKSGESQWKQVSVVGNESDESSFGGGEWYVEVELEGLIVPARLSRLKNIKADKKTMQTLQVWDSRNR